MIWTDDNKYLFDLNGYIVIKNYFDQKKNFENAFYPQISGNVE